MHNLYFVLQAFDIHQHTLGLGQMGPVIHACRSLLSSNILLDKGIVGRQYGEESKVPVESTSPTLIARILPVQWTF